MKRTIITSFAAIGLLIVGSVFATEMPPLAKKGNCILCHAIDKKVIGPAWMDVSKKYKDLSKYTYKGVEYSLEEGLALKIRKGGHGAWGNTTMPSTPPAIKDEEIKELVQFILGLDK